MSKLKSKNNYFQHSLFVPVDFALSIYNVMHNKATIKDWDTIDSFKVTDNIMVWIEDILRTNNVDKLDKELEWWRREINKR